MMANFSFHCLSAVISAVSMCGSVASLAARELGPCEISEPIALDGALASAVDIHAFYPGVSELSLEGRYRLSLAATSKSAAAAPDTISVKVVQLREGAPINGEKGYRKFVVETPGIAGSDNKGPQPTISLSAGPIQLGSGKISPEGDVLLLTDKAGLGTITVEQMDLGKFLNRPIAGTDISIVLRDSNGSEMAKYLLLGSVMVSLKAALSKGYAIIWTGAQDGQCSPASALFGY